MANAPGRVFALGSQNAAPPICLPCPDIRVRVFVCVLSGSKAGGTGRISWILWEGYERANLVMGTVCTVAYRKIPRVIWSDLIAVSVLLFAPINR